MSSILIVDDDALIREITKDILSSADHTVFTAKDSDECFNVLNKEEINVVLLDLVLSSESGMDLIPKINKFSPKSAIIVMTAHASMAIVIEALRKGAYDFLQKPFQEDKLLHALNKAVDRQGLVNQNEALVKSLEERLARLEIYKQVSMAIASTLDLQELLEKIMSMAKSIVHAEACSVLLHDEKTGELVFTVALGSKTEELNKISIKPGQGICGWVYEQKKPLLIRDAKRDKRFNQKVDLKTGFETRSMITVPLLVKDQILGVIQVINKVKGDYFAVDDLETLMTLAAPVAIAIDNARITEDLKNIAGKDALTQAYNRAKYEEILSKEVERFNRYSHPFSIILLDIDFFKKINDTYGHIAGDNTLKSLSRLIQESIRGMDSLVRWGGEEFIVMASATDLEKAKMLAERLRKIIENQRFDTAGKITISLGVASFRSDDNKDSLVKRADEALYAAKRNGRNRVEIST